jgi:hypothetical protein
MDWILDGARAAGLVLDAQGSSRIFELKPDYTDYIDNSPKESLLLCVPNTASISEMLTLKRASKARPSGEWSDDDHDCRNRPEL